MSLIKLSGNPSGTGAFTIAAPNSNTDRTLTLPDATGTVVTADGSGTIQPTNISDGTTTVGTGYVVNGSAKAWVNFSSNGGGTASIRSSFNVSSITDDATGQHTATLTSSMSSANHTPSLSGSRVGSGDYRGAINFRGSGGSTTIKSQTVQDTWTPFDWDFVFYQTFGGLA